MADLSIKQRRRGLEYAARVSALAAMAPDEITKTIVYAACRAIEKQYGFSKDEKKAVLLKLIGLGAASVAELTRESNFTRADVQSLTAELVVTKKIYEQTIRTNGRAAARFFLADTRGIYSEI